MKQREIVPGANIPKNIQNNIPSNIELIADKVELEIMEATNVKAYITDKNGNPVPNAKVSWSTSEKYGIGTITTDDNGIAIKRILKHNSRNIVVAATCENISSSITLKKPSRRF